MATTGLERSTELAGAPTIAESGFRGFNATNWYAFMLPPKTPPALVRGWNIELVAVLSAPEARVATQAFDAGRTCQFPGQRIRRLGKGDRRPEHQLAVTADMGAPPFEAAALTRRLAERILGIDGAAMTPLALTQAKMCLLAAIASPSPVA